MITTWEIKTPIKSSSFGIIGEQLKEVEWKSAFCFCVLIRFKAYAGFVSNKDVPKRLEFILLHSFSMLKANAIRKN